MSFNKRSDVSILRVLSMILIVLCHIVKYYEFIPRASSLAVVFDVGVFVFFIISGYLYGGKIVDHFCKWFVKRIVKICIPAFLVSFICIIALRFIFSEEFSFITFLVYLFNLQGLSMVDGGVSNGIFAGVPSLGPLWFVTIIMLCYILIPIFQYLRNKTIKTNLITLLIVFLFSLLIRYFWGIYLIYFVAFYVGYILANESILQFLLKGYWLFLVSLFSVSLQIIRLMLLLKYDNTSMYYTYVCISHLFFGLMIVLLVYKFCDRYSVFSNKIADSKFMKLLDSNSLYVYLVHGVFCMGRFNVYEFIDNLWISTAAFFVLTALGVFIIRFFDVYLFGFLKKQH